MVSAYLKKAKNLPAERRRFWKSKKGKNERGPQILTQKRQNLDQLLTQQTEYIYIYMNIYAVKLLTGPSLGVFKVINWSKSKLLTGPRSFSHYKNSGFRRCLFFSVIIVCVCVCLCLCVFCSELSGNFLKIAFLKKKGAKNWFFFNLLCFKLNFENSLFF